MNSNTNTTSTANNNNNTTSNNNHQNGESNEAKKVCSITVRMNGRIFDFLSQARIEKSPPSRVGEFEKIIFPQLVLKRILLVHLRNIDASELEVVQFGLAFGKITNVLNLRKKNQVNLRQTPLKSRENCLFDLGVS